MPELPLPDLPRYDPQKSYRWNFEHAPEPVPDLKPAVVPGEWSFCGLSVPSPLGIPAGPLLNGKWVLYYASLGFDVLTYKTTRSRRRECYPLPNLQPVSTGPLRGDESTLPAIRNMTGSWAVSFGMPSAAPEDWRADVDWTRSQLPKEKLLSVSVVGTVQPGWSLAQLAADYAQCAKWAVESGADCIETNFSCPNVATCDGQLYQNPPDAALIAGTVRSAIPAVPYIAKIGHVNDEAAAEELLEALAPSVDALAMTNSVAALVQQPDGSLLFEGERRGICGDATREASIAQSALFARLIAKHQYKTRIIGVGGISTAEHVREYLQAGAESVQIATAAMVDPAVGLKIREDLAASA